jgi:hypothetical protein
MSTGMFIPLSGLLIGPVAIRAIITHNRIVISASWTFFNVDTRSSSAILDAVLYCHFGIAANWTRFNGLDNHFAFSAIS